MKHYNYKLLFIRLFLVFIGFNQEAKSQDKIKSKPNIIFILTDDLGYGDVGVFFQNERKNINKRSEPYTLTPSLDKMAKEGAMLTNHYSSAPVCAPSRASLLSGLSQGHANVRDNQFDKALADNYTMGNVMQQAGYHTTAIGKWGLQGSTKWEKNGDEWPAHPLKRGFDSYIGYIRHGDGHEHYPKEGPSKISKGGPKEVYQNYKDISAGLDKCYTGDLFTAYAKKYIINHEKGERKEKPFFMYLAYDTPHAVLELPTQAYPKGFGLKGGLKWTGKAGSMINTASGVIDSWIDPEYINQTYDDDNNLNTAEKPWPDVYKRYATVTKRIDNQVNDILTLLKDLKIDDNTMVIFSSDNGPSIESYLNEPYEANFFNSFGPFNGIKRDVLEGGLRTPTIAWWPKNIVANQVITSPSISYDWLPTFTAAAGLPAPVNGNGVSLLPSLTQKGKQQKSLIYVEYSENGETPKYDEFSINNQSKLRKQMQMIRLGDTVGIRYNIQNANTDFEIYNIKEDVNQSKNLATQQNTQALQKYMKERILQIRMTDNSVPRSYDKELIPSVMIANLSNGLNWKSYQNNYLWIPNVDNLKYDEEGALKSLDIKEIGLQKNQIYSFKGFINVPEDGEYTFYLNASNKAFIKLHDTNLIDNDFGYQPNTLKESTRHLKAGLHPITIYFSNKPNINNTLSLEWKGPGILKSEIPASAYFKEK